MISAPPAPADPGSARPVASGLLLVALALALAEALAVWAAFLMGQRVTPLFGGAGGAWSVCLAGLGVSLLLGRIYALGLSRLPSRRLQVLAHGGLLAAVGAALPLALSPIAGPPDMTHPSRWMLAALVPQAGPVLAALFATGPLMQAWCVAANGRAVDPLRAWGRSVGAAGLLALAYPLVIAPRAGLEAQTAAFSLGYGLLACLVIAIAARLWPRLAAQTGAAPARASPPTRLALIGRWWRRLLWWLLSAGPASLLVGLSAYLQRDLAAAPLIWAPPLGLYLVSWGLAFQPRPWIAPAVARPLQAAGLILALVGLALPERLHWLQAGLELTGFFLTCLLCHQGLASRRAPAERLAEFHAVIAAGVAAGAAVTGLLAPVVLTTASEYPIALLLVCLARPWGSGWLTRHQTVFAIFCGAGLLAALGAAHRYGPGLGMEAGLVLAMISAFLLRDRAQGFFASCLALFAAVTVMAPSDQGLRTARDLFGVLRLSQESLPGLGGVRLMSQDGVLLGAQAMDPTYGCRPLAYAAPTTPIGQVMRARLDQQPGLRVGVVGIGVGGLAAYARPGDQFRFYAADPLTPAWASDPHNFSNLRGCAKGQADWVIGPQQDSLDQAPARSLDLLIIDASVGGAAPVHLLTVEALRADLDRLKPDGLLVLNLSSRDLELTRPVAAAAQAAGAVALRQFYRPPAGSPPLLDVAQDAVIMSRDQAALTAFARDARWRIADAKGVEAWREDRIDLLGALVRGLGHNAAEAVQFAADSHQPPLEKPAADPLLSAAGDHQAAPDTTDPGID